MVTEEAERGGCYIRANNRQLPQQNKQTLLIDAGALLLLWYYNADPNFFSFLFLVSMKLSLYFSFFEISSFFIMVYKFHRLTCLIKIIQDFVEGGTGTHGNFGFLRVHRIPSADIYRLSLTHFQLSYDLQK